MLLILILLAGMIVGILVMWIFYTRRDEETEVIGSLMENKKKNLERLLEYFENNPRVTNDDAENLLGVSNTTAYRYLEELERAGEIRQIGKTGVGVYYKKISKQ